MTKMPDNILDGRVCAAVFLFLIISQVVLDTSWGWDAQDLGRLSPPESMALKPDASNYVMDRRILYVIFPEMVPPQLRQISVSSSESTFTELCTGVIVSKRQLLTAGHCIKDFSGDPLVEVIDPGSGKVLTASKKTVHPDFKGVVITTTLTGSSKFLIHDIAMIEVSEDLDTPSMQIAQSKEQVEGLTAKPFSCGFFGYERSDLKAYWRLAGKLAAGKAPFRWLSQEIIDEYYKTKDSVTSLYGVSDLHTKIEFDDEGGKGISGGPYACLDKDGEWIIVAIVKTLYEFESVASNLEWIREALEY